MQKAAPSLPRVLTMVLFALSCFGLLLFLWLSFGGPIPFKPKKYRFQVAVPEATQLGLEADVRVAGVPIGKVRVKEPDKEGNRTLATVEVDQRFAPVRSNARAILRQKTLLGETYMELTPGTKDAPFLKENGRLGNARVQETVELDEILQALDPVTRDSFRGWQQSVAKAVDGRGQDLNDVFGNLPIFARDGSDVLKVLDTHGQALSRLVRNTGTVFGALTEREDQLRNLITGSANTFEATASQNEALAETFRIFPTFLDESKATLARLQTFATDTRPLIRDLRPVARDLRPALRATRALAPDLERFFRRMDALIRVSRTGLPALRDVLDGARPLLGSLNAFVMQLNPALEFLGLYQHVITDFLMGPPTGMSAITSTPTEGAIGNYLRQIGPTGPESLGIHRDRLSNNRGNTYPSPLALAGREGGGKRLIFPNWDCKNTGVGEKDSTPGTPSGSPGCFVEPPFEFQGRRTKFPHVEAQDYGGR